LLLQLWRVQRVHLLNLRTLHLHLHLHLELPAWPLDYPVLANCLQALWVEAALASHLGVLVIQSIHQQELLLQMLLVEYLRASKGCQCRLSWSS
jgi:hypothetical protein